MEPRGTMATSLADQQRRRGVSDFLERKGYILRVPVGVWLVAGGMWDVELPVRVTELLRGTKD